VDGAAFTSTDMAVPFLQEGILPSRTQVFGVVEGSSRFTPGNRDVARRELAVAGDPLVAWVGNLDEGKDPMVALRAFRCALGEMPGAVLGMAYRGGTLEPAVREELSRDPLLSSRVCLLGSLTHPRVETLLRASDILLAPSRYEGSGYALIEALACGTPAVASSIPAHRAVLGEAGAGVLAPIGDADGMGRALVQVAQWGRSARIRARSRFEDALSFARIGEQLREAYRNLVARGRPEMATP
jgi:glycosyltransferase involved in cell wall biosynthesis